MDLYDDLDAKPRPGQVDGWSSGIKLLQTQLQLKKAIVTAPVKKEPPKRASVSLCSNTNSNIHFISGFFSLPTIIKRPLYIL